MPASISNYPSEFQKVLAKYNADVSGVMDMLRRGDWGASDFQYRMEHLITKYAQVSWLMGSDGAPFPPGTEELIHDYVTEQLKYLKGFAAVIEAAGGKYDPAWESRARMYGTSMVVEYWEGKTLGLPLPAMPGQGTQCLGNCHCRWDIQWINEDHGDADCYWRLGAGEHCQTCQIRAEQWNPIYIRGGDLWGGESNPPAPLISAPKPSGPESGAPYGVGKIPLSRAADEKAQRWIKESGAGKLGGPSLGDLKNDICNEIVRRTGLDYDRVNESIQTWAQTSNDSSYKALYMQERASQLFGVPLSKWQGERLRAVRREARQGYGNLDTIMSEQDTDRFLRAMYDNTQEQFAVAGIKTVTLYRGASLLKEDVYDWHQGSTVSIGTNAMSSWTSDPAIAERFSASGNYEVVLSMRVPVTRVIGSARSGFGCYDEQEFVLLGYDGDQAYVHSIRDAGAALQ